MLAKYQVIVHGASKSSFVINNIGNTFIGLNQLMRIFLLACFKNYYCMK